MALANKGHRGEAPAFFFSIFLLMPKEIWPGLGWKPSSTGLEMAQHFPAYFTYQTVNLLQAAVY